MDVVCFILAVFVLLLPAFAPRDATRAAIRGAATRATRAVATLHVSSK